IKQGAFSVLRGKLCVFTDKKLTAAQISAWGMTENHVAGQSIVLVDGESQTTVNGAVHYLPTPQHQGKTFLGWANKYGEIVGNYYVAHYQAEVLTATYRESTGSGESAHNPIVLNFGVNEVDLFTDKPTYFKFANSYVTNIIIESVHLSQNSTEFCTQCNYRYVGNRSGMFSLVKSAGVVEPFGMTVYFTSNADTFYTLPQKHTYGCSYTLRYSITVI
ncbi:MAG: hypothetical protein J6Q55_00145, partial [Clostridia bacterium]|nr:hypothetical protein [Clostridia bacterium]